MRSLTMRIALALALTTGAVSVASAQSRDHNSGAYGRGRSTYPAYPVHPVSPQPPTRQADSRDQGWNDGTRFDSYLDGITMTREQRRRIDRLGNDHRSLSEWFPAVRGQLTRTQQHRLDRNRAEMEGRGNGRASDNGDNVRGWPGNGRGNRH